MNLKRYKVLILVLVEHTLGDATRLPINKPFWVLILVLVEHTLGEPYKVNELPDKTQS